MVLFAFQIAISWHVPSGYTPGACRAIQTAESLLNHFTLASSDFAMLLCIYALMGARKRYAFLIGSLAIAFYVPVFILATLFTERNIKIAEPRSLLYEELGWPCEFRFSPSIAYPTGMVVLYLVVTVLTMILGLIVLLVSYRRQQNSFIKSIRRDGGAFYVIGVSFTLRNLRDWEPCAIAITAQVQTDGGDIHDVRALHIPILNAKLKFAPPRLDSFMAPVLSAALILNLRRIDNPPSRAIVSALVFAVENDLARLGHNDNGAAQSSGDHGQAELCTETSGGRQKDSTGIHEE
ncbi:hypothetical protein NMY22_g3445 [Coprinellus aureogranulatus]|nr:hypothetical protein NMY22_g3445 [Coprinellus aureogranulatus]